ncbi:MAG: class III extradiol ring-cleavage dioxygenase [Spirochaetales bacterium]
MSRLPVLSLPHGGGPWNVMKDAFGDPAPYNELEAWLVGVGQRFRKDVKALLVISAHWEERQPTVHFGKAPGMLYDYGGFPPHTYQLKWPAPGAPAVAARVEELLKAAGFSPGRETERGYDHGTFVPMMVAFPQADLPVAQLSLLRSLDPADHVKLGAALEPLRDEGVLIIASGMSYHNMRGFMSGDPRVAQTAKAFDDWLNATVALTDTAERNKRLIAWESAPGARDCHPRSEHLIPLFVAAGAAGTDLGRTDHNQDLMGVPISGHVFG